MSTLSELFSEHWPDIYKPADFAAQLASAYPNLDLVHEAEKAMLWEERAGTKKRNHSRFFTNWLRRAYASSSARETTTKTDAALTKEASARSGKEIQRTKEYIDKLQALLPSREEKKKGVEECRKILKKLQ